MALVRSPPLGIVVSAGADVKTEDDTGLSAMYHAVFSGTADVIRELAYAGARLGSEAKIAEVMCRVGASGDEALLRKLLSAGATPDAADYGTGGFWPCCYCVRMLRCAAVSLRASLLSPFRSTHCATLERGGGAFAPCSHPGRSRRKT